MLFVFSKTIGQNTCICTKTNLAKNKQLFMTPATNFVTTLHQTFTWALSLTTNCLITGAKARFWLRFPRFTGKDWLLTISLSLQLHNPEMMVRNNIWILNRSVTMHHNAKICRCGKVGFTSWDSRLKRSLRTQEIPICATHRVKTLYIESMLFLMAPDQNNQHTLYGYTTTV